MALPISIIFFLSHWWAKATEYYNQVWHRFKNIFDVVDTFFGTVLILLSKFRMQQVNPPNNLKIVAQELTLGKSLRWLASKSSSSRLLAYLMISSGTWERLQWRLSIYSTCRLQPLNNGIHLNIVMSNGFNNRAQHWHCLLSNWNQN